MVQSTNPKDFARWYEWILNHIGFIERSTALMFYEQAYKCNCDSCRQHKEHGMMPIKSTQEQCTLDVRTTLDLEDTVKNYINS